MAEKTKIDKNEDSRVCKLCQKFFDDIYSYTDHLESKEHKKGIMKRKYAQKYLEAKSLLDEETGKKTSTLDENEKASDIPLSVSESEKTAEQLDEDDSDSDDDKVYPCKLCKKVCTGIINYKLHLQGRKHLKRVKQNKIEEELKENKISFKTYKPPDNELLSQLWSSNLFPSSKLMCELCNVKCSGPGALKQHYNGEAHKKKEAKNHLLQEMQAKGMPLNIPSEDTIGTYSCDVCQKAFSGIVPYKQHLESDCHLKKERGLQRLNELKNLCVTSPTSSKLVCKKCNKTFSGSVPFEEHLRSASHAKLEKKVLLYEELKKNHPEMVSVSVKADSENEGSDNETILPACAVCNMIFNGPEATKDHFSSLKHKKALKKEQRIKKHKNEEKKCSNHSLKSEDKKSDTEGDNSDDSFERLSPIDH